MTLPSTTKVIVTMGYGDLDGMGVHTDWPRSNPTAERMLIRVGACGLNSIDVKTRSGWHSHMAINTAGAFNQVGQDTPKLRGGPSTFPRIHSTGVCGPIVVVEADLDSARIVERET